jgi:hypothetical protein
MADDASRLELAEVCLCLAQLVRVQAAGLGEHRAARRLNCVADLVFRRRFLFLSPAMAKNEANKDRTVGAM